MNSIASSISDVETAPEEREVLIGVAELVNSIQAYNPKSNSGLIEKAYKYGRQMHRGCKRKSGADYFTHPVAVAKILADRHLDDATIVTALLHDTVEDTAATLNDIENRFGGEIRLLVDGVTKLTHFKASQPGFLDAKNFFRLMLATSRDGRTLIVKLADRLHNMRTIGHLDTSRRRRIARETLDIFSPLAEQVGLPEWCEEMEDLSFRILAPRFHNRIAQRFGTRMGQIVVESGLGPTMQKLLDEIESILKRKNISAEVVYRKKKPFSIIRRSPRKNLQFNSVRDAHGFRIITETRNDVYLALGAVHQRWPFIQERFKDYISVPKPNGYRSIHTTIEIHEHVEVEIQVRTRKMHEIAESGVAAHWVYRNGARIENEYLPENPYKWLKDMYVDFESAIESPEFWEQVNLAVTEDFVFCFSPLGDVVRLPKDSMPLDFAYKIHTRLGDTYHYAEVDGQRVAMNHLLQNGQTVEIFTSVHKHPISEWKTYAATNRAKAAIQRHINESKRGKLIAQGQKLARHAFAEMRKIWNDNALATAVVELGFSSGDELLEKIGSMEISTLELMKSVYPEEFRTDGENPTVQTEPLTNLPGSCIPDYAKCCGPVPGEEIVGVRRRNNVIQVHAKDCDHLQNMKGKDFWLELEWSKGPHAAVFPATFEVKLTNQAGALGRVCTLIGDQNANISDLHFADRNPDLYKMHVEIEFRDAEHMKNVGLAIASDKDVVGISRNRVPLKESTRAE